MKLIPQSHEILNISKNILQSIEQAGRTCYKSEDKITSDSAEKFVQRLIDRDHSAVLEFGDITVKFITNRGVTHELVRHRIGTSFAQESTRYVRYDGEMEFIKPVWWDDVDYSDQVMFEIFLEETEETYKKLLNFGWSPQMAREVLPNALKTEIVMKCNVRELRHILKLRTSLAAHPQIRELMLGLLKELQEKVPVLFDYVG